MNKPATPTPANNPPPAPQSAPSAQSAVPIPESKEVRETREASARRARYDQLTEAAKIFGVDLCNSASAIAALLEKIRDGQPGLEDTLKQQRLLFHQRLIAAKKLIPDSEGASASESNPA